MKCERMSLTCRTQMCLRRRGGVHAGRRPSLPALCSMYVPSDSFGGASPEKKAADALRKLHTFIAVKVVLAQLEGSGRGSLASYNQEAYEILTKFVKEVPFEDGEKWLAKLLGQNRSVALRVMEVRAAYCEEDFEWDTLQKLTNKDMKEANLQLMRAAATASLKASKDELSVSTIDKKDDITKEEI